MVPEGVNSPPVPSLTQKNGSIAVPLALPVKRMSEKLYSVCAIGTSAIGFGRKRGGLKGAASMARRRRSCRLVTFDIVGRDPGAVFREVAPGPLRVQTSSALS